MKRKFNSIGRPRRKDCKSICGQDCKSICRRPARKRNIERLPDDILVSILSRLNVKQAVATSILSKRWRHLWTFLTRLDFRSSSSQSKEKMGWDDDTVVNKVPRPDAYLNMVNRVVSLYRGGSALNEFRVRCRFDETESSSINAWFQFAISSRVSSLELNFQDPEDPLYCLDGETLVQQQNNNKKNYSLQPFLFDNPKGHYCFNNLKELVLKSVDVTDELFYTILVRCSYLQKLLIFRAFKLVNARCDRPLLCLKLLEIYWCDDLEHFEIRAPNLVGFHFQGHHKTNVHLKDAPQLSDLSLFTMETPFVKVQYSSNAIDLQGARSSFLHQFAPHFSQLVHLEMEIKSFQGRDEYVVPHFSNLKRLSLFVADRNWMPYSFFAVASLMKASPALLRMELHLPASLCRGSYQGAEFPKFKHQNLKEFLISGYTRDGKVLEFVKFIYECAIALKKMEVTRDLIARVTGGNEQRHYSRFGSPICCDGLEKGLRRKAKLEVYRGSQRPGSSAGWLEESFPFCGIRVV